MATIKNFAEKTDQSLKYEIVIKVKSIFMQYILICNYHYDTQIFCGLLKEIPFLIKVFLMISQFVGVYDACRMLRSATCATPT